jgi:hypothetical protein
VPAQFLKRQPIIYSGRPEAVGSETRGFGGEADGTQKTRREESGLKFEDNRACRLQEYCPTPLNGQIRH